MSAAIRVMVYAPGQPGVLQTVHNDLKSLQAIVGGYLETVPVVRGGPLPLQRRDLFAVCNEDGRSLGLPPNRRGLCGTFFVTRRHGADFVSLTEVDMQYLSKLFGEPASTAAAAPKMMPGQTPYTTAELERVTSLLSSAVDATEAFTEDELEAHAATERARK